MTLMIHKLPEVLETYFLDEAKSVPISHWGRATGGEGFLGPELKRLVGKASMAGWAITVECPGDNNLATYLALQYMLDTAKQGRWVMVITQPEGGEASPAAMWNYLQCAMGWEVGFIGAVVQGHVADIDEIRVKLEKEFSLFAYGTSPIHATRSLEGVIGGPVTINGVTIRTGDLIVGDNDGVMCIPAGRVLKATEGCRKSIVDEVNVIQHVREGRGAVDVLNLREMLKGNVEIKD